MARTAKQIKEQIQETQTQSRTARNIQQETQDSTFAEQAGEKDIFASLTNFIASTVSSIKWTPEQQIQTQEKIEQLYDLQAEVYNTAQEIKEIITQAPIELQTIEVESQPEITILEESEVE